MAATLEAKRPVVKSAQKVRDWFHTRRGMKTILWTILPGVIVAGFFWPVIGFSLLLCMAGAVVTSFWKGRAWCDVCPRGAFLDIVMKPVAGKRPIPKLLRHNAFRIGALAFVMGMMGFRLSMAWGDPAAMGFVFITLLTVTTVVGIVLALFHNARTWCVICPMGSMATWIGKKKQPLQVSNEPCVSCGACNKACPMELKPEAHRAEGQMQHGDCLKCSACVVSCPKQALSWDKA